MISNDVVFLPIKGIHKSAAIEAGWIGSIPVRQGCRTASVFRLGHVALSEASLPVFRFSRRADLKS